MRRLVNGAGIREGRDPPNVDMVYRMEIFQLLVRLLELELSMHSWSGPRRPDEDSMLSTPLV